MPRGGAENLPEPRPAGGGSLQDSPKSKSSSNTCGSSKQMQILQPQVVLQSAGFTGGDGMPTKCKVDYFDIEAIFCVIHLEKLNPVIF